MKTNSYVIKHIATGSSLFPSVYFMFRILRPFFQITITNIVFKTLTRFELRDD